MKWMSGVTVRGIKPAVIALTTNELRISGVNKVCD
jgi:hypothetical protein